MQLTEAWKNAKATDMFTICKDLASGELEGFQMPKHIQDVIDFLSQEMCIRDSTELSWSILRKFSLVRMPMKI